MVFTSKTELKNFKTAFTPPKVFSSSRNVLQILKVKADEIITNILKSITSSEGTWTTNLPTNLLLTSGNAKCLPLGFHTNKPPNHPLCCDMPACLLRNTNSEWKKFNG